MFIIGAEHGYFVTAWCKGVLTTGAEQCYFVSAWCKGMLTIGAEQGYFVHPAKHHTI